MANKKDTAFDADKFLDSYEENIRTMAPESEKQEAGHTSKPKPPARKALIASMPEREAAYLEQYVMQTQYNRVRKDGKQVFISNEFKTKIQRLLVFFSEGGSITGYVNNVLEQHFKDYEDVVSRLNDSLKI